MSATSNRTESALVLRAWPHSDAHFAALGKFHGVAHQVNQYLAQPVLVATKAGGNVRFNEAGKFQALFLCLQAPSGPRRFP